MTNDSRIVRLKRSQRGLILGDPGKVFATARHPGLTLICADSLAMLIHRAFVKEVLQTCGAVAAILFAALLIIRLIGFLGQAAEGYISVDSVLLLLLLKMITYLDILVPLVLYISILLVMGRWIRDNELTVINACGIGMAQFIRALLALFVIVGSVVAVFSLYLSPLATQTARVISHQYRSRVDVGGVPIGVFAETKDGNSVYFVERYDAQTDTLRDIFVYSREGAEQNIIVADSGLKMLDQPSQADFLVLHDGRRYRATAGMAAYGVLDFAAYAVRLPATAPADYRLPFKARPTLELLADPHPAATGELYWRLSKVVMLPILMLYALSFSSIAYRRQRLVGMVAALLVYFVYSNLLGSFLALIQRAVISPPALLWVVHLVFLVLALGLFYRRSQDKQLLPGLPA